MIAIPGLVQMTDWVARAFKDTWAQMEDIFLVEHDEDGHHTEITAQVVTSDAATITTLTVEHLELGDEDFTNGVEGVVIGPDTFEPGDGTVTADITRPAVQFERDLIPATDNTQWLGWSGAGAFVRRWKGVAASYLVATTQVQAPTVIATTAIYERGYLAAVGEGTPYTPTWSSSGTPPTTGNATLAGRYMRLGKMVFVELSLVYGSTSSPGTGSWTLSLPSTAVSTSFSVMTADIVDAGTTHYVGFARLASTTAVNVFTNLTTGIGATVPITWATGDQVIVSGWYLEA